MNQKKLFNLFEDQIVTFLRWGNFLVLDKIKNENDQISVQVEFLPDSRDFKKTIKIAWIADVETVNINVVEYKHLLKEPLIVDEKETPFEKQLNEVTKITYQYIGESAIKNLEINQNILIQKQDQYILLERKGYFRVVHIQEKDLKFTFELIYVPDGKLKIN